MADETPKKPGYKTTEFWLTVASQAVGLFFASGMLDLIPGSVDDQVFGLAAMVLTTMGYTVSRTIAKK